AHGLPVRRGRLRGLPPSPAGERRAHRAEPARGLVRLRRAHRRGRAAHAGRRAVSRFLGALRREAVDSTPIWLMRQAGRSLPEYRKLRERYTLEAIVAEPDLCAEVTLQPERRLDVDAAVMFADIMLPLKGMGVAFELVENVGPVVARPIRSEE